MLTVVAQPLGVSPHRNTTTPVHLNSVPLPSREPRHAFATPFRLRDDAPSISTQPPPRSMHACVTRHHASLSQITPMFLSELALIAFYAIFTFAR